MSARAFMRMVKLVVKMPVIDPGAQKVTLFWYVSMIDAKSTSACTHESVAVQVRIVSAGLSLHVTGNRPQWASAVFGKTDR